MKLVSISNVGALTPLAKARKAVKSKRVVDYRTSDLTSPHVLNVLKYLLSEGLATQEEIEEGYTAAYTKLENYAEISPILYGDTFANVGESFAFDLLRTKLTDDAPVKGAPRFGGVMLSRLFDYVRVENKAFFPLRDLYSRTVFTGTPNLISVPSKTYPEYSKVDTAAIFSNVDIALNQHFMQRVIDFTHLTGIKSASPKYKSNGGRVVDAYCMVETILVHELRHFSYGDLSLNQIMDTSPEILNFAQDFRINHNLLKTDQVQLPLGCFSSKLNYDTHGTLKDIVEVVTEELKKFHKADRQAGEEPNPMAGDEHYTQDGTYRPRAEGEPDKSIPNKTNSAVQRILKRVTASQVEATEEMVTQNADPDAAGEGGAVMLPGGPQNAPNDAKIQVRKIETNAEPKYDWKTILRRAVKSADDQVEESYAKPSRRAISRIAAAIETGVAAVKPGEVKTDMSKFVIISDTSYSMIDVTKKVTAEFLKLLKLSEFGDEFYLFQFSDTFDAYQCSVRKKRAYRLTNEHLKKTGSPVPLSEAFAGRFQGTNFTKRMADHLINLAAQGYNIIMATDTDVFYSSNKEQLDRVFKYARRKFYVILDGKDSYNHYTRMYPLVSRNVTYWS